MDGVCAIWRTECRLLDLLDGECGLFVDFALQVSCCRASGLFVVEWEISRAVMSEILHYRGRSQEQYLQTHFVFSFAYIGHLLISFSWRQKQKRMNVIRLSCRSTMLNILPSADANQVDFTL